MTEEKLDKANRIVNLKNNELYRLGTLDMDLKKVVICVYNNNNNDKILIDDTEFELFNNIITLIKVSLNSKIKQLEEEFKRI